MAKLIGRVTEWARVELEDRLGGADLNFDGEFYLEEDDSSGYVEGVTVNGSCVNVYGRLEVFGEPAHRVATAIRIESAESIADLPEGLADEDKDMRDLARETLDRLGFETGYKKSLKEIDELLNDKEQ